MYHEITPSGETPSRLGVPEGAFAAQLAHLHAEGFTTVTASALAKSLAEGSDIPDRVVAITFDDGFADLNEIAMPLLDRYNFTATVFVTTDWVQDAAPKTGTRRPGRMLTWKQVRDLSDAGVEVAAHSCSHPQLDQLPQRQVESELRISKEVLEAELGRAVEGMAYPYGYSTAAVRQTAFDVGYRYACIVGNGTVGPNCDEFALPRLTVSRSTGQREFSQIIYGRRIRLLFLKEHVLTRGWSVIRGARSMIRTGD
jgi:peptidoglycan/xylan/chitin deacetylase (PgdA/CDA1 family)